MIFEVHHPAEPLSRFVADMVFYSDVELPYDKEKLLPDGSIFMLFDMIDKPKKLFRNDDFSKYTEFTNSYLSGQHKHFIHIEVTKGASMMVIRFKPGGAFAFFDFAIGSINNKVVQLEPLLGDAVSSFRDRVKAGSTVKSKFDLAEQYLKSMLKEDLSSFYLLEPAVEFLLKNPEQATTKKLAELVGVSQKHLIHLFSKQVGLNPKSLARVIRFQRVLETLEKPETADWLEIAINCGYYDQAHFSRDFYTFSGLNPSHYLSQKGDFMNYIPVR